MIVYTWSIYVNILNNRFTENLSYSGHYEEYRATYKGYNLSVPSELKVFKPQNPIYAQIIDYNVANKENNDNLVMRLMIYETWDQKFSYQFIYEGPEVITRNGNVTTCETAYGEAFMLDSKMNVIKLDRYKEKYEQYLQFVRDYEDELRKMIDVANMYWDLGLTYEVE